MNFYKTKLPLLTSAILLTSTTIYAEQITIDSSKEETYKSNKLSDNDILIEGDSSMKSVIGGYYNRDNDNLNDIIAINNNITFKGESGAVQGYAVYVNANGDQNVTTQGNINAEGIFHDITGSVVNYSESNGISTEDKVISAKGSVYTTSALIEGDTIGSFVNFTPTNQDNHTTLNNNGNVDIDIKTIMHDGSSVIGARTYVTSSNDSEDNNSFTTITNGLVTFDITNEPDQNNFISYNVKGVEFNGTGNLNNGKLGGINVLNGKVNVATKGNENTYFSDGIFTGAEINLVGDKNTNFNLKANGDINFDNTFVHTPDNTNISGVNLIVYHRPIDTEILMNNPIEITGNVTINGGGLSGNVNGINIETIDVEYFNAKLSGNINFNGYIDYDLNDHSLYGVNYLSDNISVNGLATNNTLIMNSNPFEIGRIGNFNKFIFNINQYNKIVIDNDSDALITVINELTNQGHIDDTKDIKSKVELTGISGINDIKNGSKINLITLDDNAIAGYKVVNEEGNASVKETKLDDLFELSDKKTVQVGLVRQSSIDYGVSEDGKSIYAQITKDRISQDLVNRNIKPLAESRLSVLGNTLRYADSLTDIISDKQKEIGTFTPVAVISGDTGKFNHGSANDYSGFRFLVGSRYQFTDNLFAGIVVGRGQTNFTTHTDGMYGAGHTYNYGVSVFSKYSKFINGDEIYADGALGFGRTSTDYHNGDIEVGSGKIVDYNSKANYISGQIGTGYVYNINKIYGLDTSIHYLYTHIGKDSQTIDGDKINFNSINSSRAQIKEQFNYQQSNRITLTLAAAYEYEFSGKANANVMGYGVDAPSLKGSTGIFTIGAVTQPSENIKNLKFNLAFSGYTGQRKGGSFNAGINYDF